MLEFFLRLQNKFPVIMMHVFTALCMNELISIIIRKLLVSVTNALIPSTLFRFYAKVEESLKQITKSCDQESSKQSSSCSNSLRDDSSASGDLSVLCYQIRQLQHSMPHDQFDGSDLSVKSLSDVVKFMEGLVTLSYRSRISFSSAENVSHQKDREEYAVLKENYTRDKRELEKRVSELHERTSELLSKEEHDRHCREECRKMHSEWLGDMSGSAGDSSAAAHWFDYYKDLHKAYTSLLSRNLERQFLPKDESAFLDTTGDACREDRFSQTELGEKEIEALTLQLEKQREERSPRELTDEVSELKDRLSSVLSDYKELNKENENLRQLMFSKENKEIHKMKCQLESLEMENRKLGQMTADYESQKEFVISERQKVITLSATNERLLNELKKMEGTKVSSEDMSVDCEVSKTDLDCTENEKPDNPMDMLHTTLKEKDIEILQLNEKLLTKNKELEDVMITKQQEMKHKEIELAELNVSRAEVETELLELSGAQLSMEKEVNNLRQQLRRLSSLRKAKAYSEVQTANAASEEEISSALRKVMNAVYKECRSHFGDTAMFSGEDVKSFLLNSFREYTLQFIKSLKDAEPPAHVPSSTIGGQSKLNPIVEQPQSRSVPEKYCDTANGEEPSQHSQTFENKKDPEVTNASQNSSKDSLDKETVSSDSNSPSASNTNDSKLLDSEGVNISTSTEEKPMSSDDSSQSTASTVSVKETKPDTTALDDTSCNQQDSIVTTLKEVSESRDSSVRDSTLPDLDSTSMQEQNSNKKVSYTLSPDSEERKCDPEKKEYQKEPAKVIEPLVPKDLFEKVKFLYKK